LVARDVVAPEDVATGFDDIGGEDSVIAQLRTAVLRPLRMQHVQGSALLQPPQVGPPRFSCLFFF
jgi:hypothetical protein